MAEIFQLLPKGYILDLDLKQRDTLLHRGEYILPGGDSEITEKCTISLKDSNYLFFNYYYTTGQNAFVTIELKKFKRNNGSFFIVYSRVGGMLRAYDQQDVLIFDYKNSRLFLNKEKLLPLNIPIKNFLIQGTSESIAKKIEGHVTGTYSLHDDGPKSVSYNLFQSSVLDDLEKYLLSDTMIFTWNGKSFTRKLYLDKKD